MSDDLVKRLRDMNGGWASDEALAAADRIESLEAELREAHLQALAAHGQANDALDLARRLQDTVPGDPLC